MKKCDPHTGVIGGEGWGRTCGLDFKLFHEQVGNKWADGRIHGHTMNLFKILTLEEIISIFQAKLQPFDYLRDRHGKAALVVTWFVLC